MGGADSGLGRGGYRLNINFQSQEFQEVPGLAVPSVYCGFKWSMCNVIDCKSTLQCRNININTIPLLSADFVISFILSAFCNQGLNVAYYN